MASSVPPQHCWPPFPLHNGHELPAVGFGTFRIKDRETIFTVIDAALRCGYRSFDTAAVYANEMYIGEALHKYLPQYDLDRDDIYITSKLSNAEHGSKHRVYDAFEKTENHLGYTPDLYLIHYPGSAKLEPRDHRNRAQRHSAWEAVATLYDTGRVPSIGVSNFTVDHLDNLLKVFHSNIPVVNQVEWHPMYYDEELLKFCNENSIQLQGYHTLGGVSNCATLFKNHVVKEIADDRSVTVSQVLLTWSLQKGVAVIPKSINPKHIAENIELNYKMSADEMNAIDHCSTATARVKFAWDSTNVF